MDKPFEIMAEVEEINLEVIEATLLRCNCSVGDDNPWPA
jgi:hypothetical protein